MAQCQTEMPAMPDGTASIRSSFASFPYTETCPKSSANNAPPTTGKRLISSTPRSHIASTRASVHRAATARTDSVRSSCRGWVNDRENTVAFIRSAPELNAGSANQTQPSTSTKTTRTIKANKRRGKPCEKITSRS